MGIWTIKIVERRKVCEEFPLEIPAGEVPPDDLEHGGRLFARIMYKSHFDSGQAAYREVRDA